jgi:hypothetical protein
MTKLNVIERSPRFIDFAIPVEDGISSYTILVAKLLNDAYAYTGALTNGVTPVAAADVLFNVPTGTSFRSPGIRQRRLGRTDESQRGLTRIVFDIMDYFGPANPNTPHDSNIAFFLVRPFSVASGALLEPTAIYVVPPPDFFCSPSPVVTLTGTAPNTGMGTVGGNILAQVNATTNLPPGAMNIVLPRMTHHVALRSLAAPAGADLLYSFDVGNTSSTLPAEEFYDATLPSAKYVLLEGEGATVDFSLQVAVAMGQ